MDVDEALRIVGRVAAANEGYMVAVDTAQTLADGVRDLRAERDEWQGRANARQALLDEQGDLAFRLRRERDEARLWQKHGASEVACLRAERNAAREKLDAWAESLSAALGVDPATEDVMAALSDELASWRRQVEAATAECDQTQGAWSDLMEFIRSALNLDVRALDDVAEVRKILGRAFADARLWARVKELAAGNFRAGDTVTADALNAFGEAFNEFGAAMKAGRKPGITILSANAPARQHFSIGAPEPASRVTRVTRPQHSPAGAVFTRVGVLTDGKSVWRRDGDDSALLLRWSEIVRYQAAVEA